MKHELEYLLQTKFSTSEKFADIDDSSSQYYQENICVICDEFIISTRSYEMGTGIPSPDKSGNLQAITRYGHIVK
jgi:thymidylate kinase